MPEKQKTQTKYYNFDNIVTYAIFLHDNKDKIKSEYGVSVEYFAQTWTNNEKDTVVVVNGDTFYISHLDYLPEGAHVELVHPTVDELKNYMVVETNMSTGEVREFKFSYIKHSWNSGIVYCTPKSVDFDEKLPFCDQYSFALSPLAIVVGTVKKAQMNVVNGETEYISKLVNVVPDYDAALTEDEFKKLYPEFYSEDETRYLSHYTYRGGVNDMVKPYMYDEMTGLCKFTYIKTASELNLGQHFYAYDMWSSMITPSNFAMTPKSFIKFCNATKGKFNDFEKDEEYDISIYDNSRDAMDSDDMAEGFTRTKSVEVNDEGVSVGIKTFYRVKVLYECANVVILQSYWKSRNSYHHFAVFKSNIYNARQSVHLAKSAHFVIDETNLAITDDRLNNLVDLVKDQYQEASYPTSSYAMKDIVYEWNMRKSPIINLLRKSKYWNEDALAIVKDIEVERPPVGTYQLLISTANIFDTLRSVINVYLDGSYTLDPDDGPNTACTKMIRYIRDVLYKSYNLYSIQRDANAVKNCDLVSYDDTAGYTLQDQEFVTQIKEYAKAIGKKINIATGMKFTRAVNNICNAILSDSRFDVYAKREYERMFAQLSDDAIQSKRTVKYLISVHPVDYLRMSYGNSWFSCHYLDADDRDHCYQAGTQCYMTDSTSVITYTFMPDEAEDVEPSQYYRIPKLNRQMVMVTNGAFLQSRLYPDYQDRVLNDILLKELKEEFSKLMGVDNWENINTFSVFDTNPDSFHYPDYDYADYNTRTFIKSGIEFDRLVSIGSYKICPSCGDFEYYNDGDCKSNTCLCYSCGREFYGYDDDDYYNDEDDEDYYYDDEEREDDEEDYE